MALGGRIPPYYPTRLNSIRLGEAVLGTPIPIVFGQSRIAGKLIWYGDFQSQKAQQPGGSGLGKAPVNYVYSAAIAAALCEGPIKGLLNVWDSTGRFVLESTTENYTVPTGGGSYTVINGSIFGLDHGVGAAYPYSYAVNDYGSPGPNTLSGTDNYPLAYTSGAPGTGQYTYNPSTGQYTFAAGDAGKVLSITYSFYRYQLSREELSVVPSSGPYNVVVDNATYFEGDLGVVYYPSGIALTAVSGTPSHVGQYNPNGGTYEFYSGDAGKGIAITYKYKDVNIDYSAPSTLNLTLFLGNKGQAAWAFLENNYPPQAIGYTMLAYLASSALYLGQTPMMPNYNYEIAGLLPAGAGVKDANPADCVYAMLTDPGYGVGFDATYIDDVSLRGTGVALGTASPSMKAMCAANGFFISAALRSQQSCASTIGQWLEASQTGVYWSEGLLKFKPYYGSSAVGNGWFYAPPTQPVVSLDDTDFMVEGNEDPVKVTRTPWQDAYNRAQVSWDVRANDYNPDVTYAQDEGSIQRYGLRIEDPIDYTFIADGTAAQFAANMRVQRTAQIRNTYQFTLQESYCYLEPMDVVEITDTTLGLVNFPVRLTSVDYDPTGPIDCEAEDFPWALLYALEYPKQSTLSTNVLDLGRQDPGNTVLTILEGNNRLNKQVGYILYVAAAGANQQWGGCNIWISLDGSIYNKYYTFQQASRIGTLTAGLPIGSDPDTTDTLSVKMINSAAGLVTVPQATADAFGTLAAVITSGAVELVSYENANLAGVNLYNLTYLRRGVYGTTIAAHNSGDEFLRLDDGVFQYQYDPSYVGKTIYIKATSFNTLGINEQSLSQVTAVAVTLQGVATGIVDIFTGYINSGVATSADQDVVAGPIAISGAGPSPFTLAQVTITPDGGYVSVRATFAAGNGTANDNLPVAYVYKGTWSAGVTKFGYLNMTLQSGIWTPVYLEGLDESPGTSPITYTLAALGATGLSESAKDITFIVENVKG